ncbi:MAG TPA: TonB family protein [Candidatus Acidoferrales bacterium]|jgi:TonB family protein|nr:TonB family protein [Candidatus Acidoferrales bacterium]
MHGDFERIEELPGTDRRTYSRQSVRTLTYVELDEGNGGIVLNASEGGLSVQAVMSLMEDSLPKMRFRLSQSKDWLETAARVVWVSESRKVAGLQFVDMPEQTRLHIREWLTAEAAGVEAPSEAPLPSEREFSAVVKEPDAGVDPNLVASLPASAPEPTPVSVPASRVVIPKETPDSKASPLLDASVASDADANRSDHAWNIAGLVAILAIVSLAAGWVAGRGALDNLWKGFRATASPSTAAKPSPAASASAPISQIETIDIHNQHWTIPFGAPTTNNQAGFPISTSQSAPSSTWPTSDPALATPQIQSRSGGNAPSQQPNPPAVGEPSGSAASISLPSQSVDPRDITPPTPETDAQPAPQASSLRRGVMIYHVNPVYPDLAREQGIQGTVELEVTIGINGVVRSVTALSGPGMLIEAARSAVRRWRYTPSLLNGKPIESTVDVSVVFHLPPSP